MACCLMGVRQAGRLLAVLQPCDCRISDCLRTSVRSAGRTPVSDPEKPLPPAAGTTSTRGMMWTTLRSSSSTTSLTLTLFHSLTLTLTLTHSHTHSLTHTHTHTHTRQGAHRHGVRQVRRGQLGEARVVLTHTHTFTHTHTHSHTLGWLGS